MNIALIGATGTVGKRIFDEAVRRQHHVTAIVRDPAKLGELPSNAAAVQGDIFDPESLASLIAGAEIIISAYGPGVENPHLVMDSTQALLSAVRASGLKRIMVVGGAGSLEVAPGLKLIDAPNFPEAWKGIALAHSEVLDMFRSSANDLEWIYASPAALIEPGERTGKFRIGGDQLLTDAQGNSRISCEDFAIAMLDEAENPKHIRGRFTAAY